MALIAHIISSVLGIVGSYISSIALFRNAKRGLPLVTKPVRVGMTVAIVGIVGVAISGVFLFIADPETFLDSGKFLSNMTIMTVLLVTEISFFVLKKNIYLVLNRAVSMFSWTWIFVMALWNPPYPYIYFIVGYTISLSIILFVTRKWATETFSKPQ